MDKLISKIKKRFSGEDLVKIEKAYEAAKTAHKGQKRHTGDPYMAHPLAVAEILMEMKADAHTICGGLLHDTVEDTEISLNEIKDKFSKDIYKLIRALTKFHVFSDKKLNSINYDRKLKEAGKKDTRVSLIKLADRLHNSRTVDGLSIPKRKRLAKQNKDFFIPLAKQLGFDKYAKELESISNKYL